MLTYHLLIKSKELFSIKQILHEIYESHCVNCLLSGQKINLSMMENTRDE